MGNESQELPVAERCQIDIFHLPLDRPPPGRRNRTE